MEQNLITDDVAPDDLARARRYLERFGYGTRLAEGDGGRTAKALNRFQTYHGLSVGPLNLETLQAMANPRCGLREVFLARASKPPCPWKVPTKVAVEFVGTEPFTGAFEEVRVAMGTWNSELTRLRIKLQLVEAANPDVVIEWIAKGSDQDLPGGMGGVVVAHADYAPDCAQLGVNPLPVHFDLEHEWSKDESSNTFDVQTVALHELGHILGLVHDGQGAVMFPNFTEQLAKHDLTNADLTAIKGLYTP